VTEFETLLSEVLEAVEHLNDFDESERSGILGEMHHAGFRSDGCCIIIEFAGYTLWSSEEDDREFILGDWEPLKPFVVKKYNELIKELSKHTIMSESE